MLGFCRLLALMGPSGSGKTTLLNALATQVPAKTGMRITGEVQLTDSRTAKYQVTRVTCNTPCYAACYL